VGHIYLFAFLKGDGNLFVIHLSLQRLSATMQHDIEVLFIFKATFHKENNQKYCNEKLWLRRPIENSVFFGPTPVILVLKKCICS
jgi:hypothetical protein